MKISIKDKLSYFDSLSHEEKYEEVKNMTKLIGDIGGDLNGLYSTLKIFGKQATDEDLKIIYENILSLIKKYQDFKIK